MMKPIVELKHLSKNIKGKEIVKDLNIELFPGQITGFLGPNGAGKTTTIRLMTGLMKPTGGEVLIDGISLAKDFEKAISKVGVIVENPEMYKFMSGYKNLLHFARMHDNVTKERIGEVVSLVGLENRIHEKVSTYSLGMRQRLGLAQALLHHPKFLILDEPTNGLDPAGIREFREHLRTIAQKEQVSIFVSSHLLAEIELICDRIAVIKSGQLIEIREMTTEQQPIYYLEAGPDSEQLLTTQNYVFEKFGNGYLVSIDRDAVPKLISKLSSEGIDIFAIQPHHQSLEDQFLEITGGGQIVKASAK
ncbi:MULTISPECIES: ABC transporter ATP-binding protein [unclassified Rummeliibacillus]|uniref:ABC transporter ATP-binding protein n=1 Tax=unclassified Rummeliibacillus TaxID=2622809 RepID=UPI000E667AFD|nr:MULTISPECIES: ABC transporter ATP-binding protein [unclassified Rummeliibacillus]RIJ65755.1 ABC transporter ATP-binding protein [Rummeliibacillus sp. POC4]RPJ95695.1 ABC transporter ATP-binding protein [Rummeliibacillus sp. TYF005]